MNTMYRQMYALVIFAVVATTASMRGMENEVASFDVVEQQIVAEELPVPALWYKKRSVQAAAIAMTTAMALYACAVYKGKISSPAALLGMIFALVAKDSTNNPGMANNVVDTNLNVPVTETHHNAHMKTTEITPGTAQQSVEQSDMGALWNKFKNIVMHTTDKDLKDKHLDAFNQ